MFTQKKRESCCQSKAVFRLVKLHALYSSSWKDEVSQKCFAYMWELPFPRFLLNSILILTEKNHQAPFHKLRNYTSSVTSVAQFCQAMKSSYPYHVQGQAQITKRILKRCLILVVAACRVVTFHNSL